MLTEYSKEPSLRSKIIFGIGFVPLFIKLVKMTEKMKVANVNNKYRDLILGILFDGIGMLSFSIPLVGEFSDVVWAPLSGFLMMKMYKGNTGKIAGTFSFLEELIPFTDVIPSFTLTWIYNYWIKKQK